MPEKNATQPQVQLPSDNNLYKGFYEDALREAMPPEVGKEFDERIFDAYWDYWCEVVPLF
ncbi:hypothetical protein DBT_0399 [Dissulfuribacter thermophilus]|uniref:Uncharacterized protein n=1 Tax=Dissulfuribacter thermophilus TaxID=1156395 RepID=A0A1B9F9Y2_9BACT|nr:hypothetical protein [Dissulfuribacter thermophilus]OCC16581.1 hypothetical protein DBT_0399 [Dissulfuribacter thermophilus]